MTIEKEKQSRYSPGPVLSEEILLRIIYYPSHINDDGKLAPEAIPIKDLSDRGFSTYRKLYVKREKISHVIDNYVSKKPERECRGISPILCETIRSVNDKEARKAFDVLDDARTKDDKAHAEIKFSRDYGKSVQRGLRKKLKDKFTAIHEVETVYAELNETNQPQKVNLFENIIATLSYWWNKFTGK